MSRLAKSRSLNALAIRRINPFLCSRAAEGQHLAATLRLFQKIRPGFRLTCAFAAQSLVRFHKKISHQAAGIRGFLCF